MVLTNPTHPLWSRRLFLLSIFLALVALPLCMGIFLAIRPFGAWAIETVEDPLRFLHPIALISMVFSGMGFSFFLFESFHRYGYTHSRSLLYVTWIWTALVILFIGRILRTDRLDSLFSNPIIKIVISLAIGVYLPVLFLYIWKAEQKRSV